MARSTYHHGDLRAALLEAGLDITRDGGPDALSIRNVTRQVGVSPNAAYRHFADRTALLAAVAGAVQERMAALMVVRPQRGGTEQSRARARVRAVGEGYIEFALTEPGWFQVAFFGAGPPALAVASAARTPPPFVTLQESLDGLVEAGILTSRQRAGAEWPCWATAHGFCELALKSPLRDRPIDERRRLGARAIETIICGLDRE